MCIKVAHITYSLNENIDALDIVLRVFIFVILMDNSQESHSRLMCADISVWSQNCFSIIMVSR